MGNGALAIGPKLPRPSSTLPNPFPNPRLPRHLQPHRRLWIGIANLPCGHPNSGAPCVHGASPCGDLDERSRKICPLAPRSHTSTPIIIRPELSLYTGLTETQRQAVDTLFAEQALAACQPRTAVKALGH